MLNLQSPSEIEPYLSDASRFQGQAEGVVCPESEQEVAEFLREAHARKIPVTLSGGKTGLAGGAVPLTGWVLSTEKLCRILEVKKPRPGREASASAEPGILLCQFRAAVEQEGFFYPPDPTGPKAYLGGTLATNASGPNSFKYGSTRRFIRRIRGVLATGEIVEIRRGEQVASRQGILEIPLEKRKLKVPVPHYRFPAIKHAGGYFAGPNLDAVDLFIGSEGTLGVVTEIEAALLPLPPQVLAFLVFFRSEEESWRFAARIREGGLKESGPRATIALHPRVLEYFDHASLDFLKPQFENIPREARACLFVEQEATDESQDSLLQKWLTLCREEKALEEVWLGQTPEKREGFRKFRSELPLRVNEFIAQHGQMKMSTDTSVPPDQFETLMLFQRRLLEEAGLRSAAFGHIGENHVHWNLLPRNDSEAEKARSLYRTFVEKAMELGGTFSAEHGVGKLKRAYLEAFYGPPAIQEMAAIKRIFDPHLILGQGNLFEIK